MASFTRVLPEDIWFEIISYIRHDRYLEPLSLVSKTFLSITNRHKQTLKIFNESFLPSIFRRFTNLKHISFSQFSNDPLPILHQIANFNFPLETLDLTNHHRQITVNGFKRWTSSMRNGVKSFKKRSRTFFDHDDLEIIAHFFPNLEELDLSYLSTNDDDYMLVSYSRDIFNHTMHTKHRNSLSELRNLRRIKLNNYSGCLDEALVLLCKNCPNLEAIGVKMLYPEAQNEHVFTLQACKNLESIQLDGLPTPESLYTDLVLCRRLTDIRFSKMQVSDATLCSIVEFDLQLKSFALSRCWGFTDAGITSFLEHYDSLDYVALKRISILTDESILALAKCLTKARNVNLSHSQKLTDLTLFVLIEQCPLLESLAMKNTMIGLWKTSSFGASNDAIRTLNLSDNNNLRDVCLKRIVLACPNLEVMRLRNCVGISRKGVGEIMRSCCSLRQLRLDGCSCVTNLDLDSKELRLERLVVCETRLNDKGLIDIAEKCPNLVCLNLRGCTRFTPKGVLTVVDKCTKLKAINYGYCEYMSKYMFEWIRVNKPFLRNNARY